MFADSATAPRTPLLRRGVQGEGSAAKLRRNDFAVLADQIDVSHRGDNPYDKPARPAAKGLQVAIVGGQRFGVLP